MNEQIDIVNEKDEIIGQADIIEAHKKGLLHRAVHIFIINSKGRLFCRQRSFKKSVYPGYWSTSAALHVMHGQSYDQTAKKCIKSILGIECDLKVIGKINLHDKIENETGPLYIGYSDEKMKFNKEQIEGGKFLTIDEIRQLAKKENVTPHLLYSLEVYLKYKNKGSKNNDKDS